MWNWATIHSSTAFFFSFVFLWLKNYHFKNATLSISASFWMKQKKVWITESKWISIFGAIWSKWFFCGNRLLFNFHKSCMSERNCLANLLWVVLKKSVMQKAKETYWIPENVRKVTKICNENFSEFSFSLQLRKEWDHLCFSNKMSSRKMWNCEKKLLNIWSSGKDSD